MENKVLFHFDMDSLQTLISALNEMRGLNENVRWNIRTGLDSVQKELQNGKHVSVVSTSLPLK